MDTQCYPIHSIFMALGPRRSCYFETMMNSTAFALPPDRTTDLSDMPEACKTFEVMEALLDWVYLGETTNFHPRFLIPLVCLADRLQIDSLYPVAMSILSDSEGWTGVMLRDALLLKQTHVMDTLLNQYAKNISLKGELNLLLEMGKKRSHSTLSSDAQVVSEPKRRRVSGLDDTTVPVETSEVVETKEAENLSSLMKEDHAAKGHVPLFEFPHWIVSHILSLDQVKLHHEDSVFFYLEGFHKAGYLANTNEETKLKLWESCRYAYLSCDVLIAAISNLEIPRFLLAGASLIRLLLAKKTNPRTEDMIIQQLSTSIDSTPPEWTWHKQVRRRACSVCQKGLDGCFATSNQEHQVYHAGREVDLWCDIAQKWFQGVILYRTRGTRIQIHYFGWSNDYDQEIDIENMSIAPLHTFTSPPREHNRHGVEGPTPVLRRQQAAGTPPIPGV